MKIEDFEKLHTIIIVPAALKTAAKNAIKKHIDRNNWDSYFSVALYTKGSVVFDTPAAYLTCVKLPIWIRIKLETLVAGLNNANVWVEDVDVRTDIQRVTDIIDSLNLMRGVTKRPGQ